jgi:hypothetical protein
MTARILKANGKVVRRNTFRHLHPEEFESEECRRERSLFNNCVAARLGEPLSETDNTAEFDIAAVTPEYEVFEDGVSQPLATPDIDDVVGTNEYDPEGYNGYITAQVLLPRGDEYKTGTVVSRCKYTNGNPTGKSK